MPEEYRICPRGNREKTIKILDNTLKTFSLIFEKGILERMIHRRLLYQNLLETVAPIVLNKYKKCRLVVDCRRYVVGTYLEISVTQTTCLANYLGGGLRKREKL